MPRDQLVGRDADTERPEGGGLLQEAHVVGAQVVQARLHDHGRAAGRLRHDARTAIREEPGGGVSEATIT